MKPFKPTRHAKRGPEAQIQDAVMSMLLMKGWYVKHLHGNMFQYGLPDLFCTHYQYGIRLVEIKQPVGYSFTPAQKEEFPKIIAHGCGIWVLTAATEEEYQKLFKRSNLYLYLDIMKL